MVLKRVLRYGSSFSKQTGKLGGLFCSVPWWIIIGGIWGIMASEICSRFQRVCWDACMGLMGLGDFFFSSLPPSLYGGVMELAAELNGCAWCWVVHKTISRLKCDCFNTLIHLSLAFRMLQKLPNYSCALYPAWLKHDRGISLRLTERRLSWRIWTFRLLCEEKKTNKHKSNLNIKPVRLTLKMCSFFPNF